jgi:hypothetical protein
MVPVRSGPMGLRTVLDIEHRGGSAMRLSVTSHRLVAKGSPPCCGSNPGRLQACSLDADRQLYIVAAASHWPGTHVLHARGEGGSELASWAPCYRQP